MRESLKPKLGKPRDTAGNRERSDEFAIEFLTPTQLASFTAIKVMDEVMCANALDDQTTAKLIGKSKGDFSKVRRSRIDDMCRTIAALTRIKGHAGLIQKIAHDAGVTLLRRPRRKGGRA